MDLLHLYLRIHNIIYTIYIEIFSLCFKLYDLYNNIIKLILFSLVIILLVWLFETLNRSTAIIALPLAVQYYINNNILGE